MSIDDDKHDVRRKFFLIIIYKFITRKNFSPESDALVPVWFISDVIHTKKHDSGPNTLI